MKNIIYKSIIGMSILLFPSCNDWLDIKPVEQVDAEEMFEDERGFKQTLNGCYLTLSGTEAYGRELTAGFPDEIVHYWNEQSEFYDFNYADVAVVNTLDGVWNTLYTAIANVNLLLGNLSPDATTFSHYNLIRGEALGLRAYIHLDLLRLFGPVLDGDFEQTSIPYREEFSNNLVQRMSAKEVLLKIERDLLEAYSLLKDDPIKEYGRRNTSVDTEVEGLAFDFRGLRMNYYAVCATLARMYLLKADYVNALKYASEVIDAKDIFQLLQRNDIVVPQTEKDLMFEREVIWTLYEQNTEMNLSNRFTQETYTFPEEMWTYVYVNGNSYGSLEDYRQSNWKIKPYYQYTLGKYVRQKDTTGEDVSVWTTGVPMIRLTEMYYIAAECQLQTNPAEAYRLLNEVRVSRNLSVLPEYLQMDVEALLNQIVYESRKDFWGEGKLFYLYKRLNKGIELPDRTIPASKDLFELPIPQDELEYGGN